MRGWGCWEGLVRKAGEKLSFRGAQDLAERERSLEGAPPACLKGPYQHILQSMQNPKTPQTAEKQAASRRQFIGGAAAAAAAVNLPIEACAQVAGSDELKLALVGCGGRGGGAAEGERGARARAEAGE